MDDEPPKRTSATRPRERLRLAGWNVRINELRARVHVMSIEGVAGMHGSSPGLSDTGETGGETGDGGRGRGTRRRRREASYAESEQESEESGAEDWN